MVPGLSLRPIGSESFLNLPENRYAIVGVEGWAMSSKPASLVFLYGQSGIGKSHLARHGLRMLASENPSLRVVHQEADEFAAQFSAATDRKSLGKFQAVYRDLECFILEDVHTLENRYLAQHQLMAILDDLSAHGCHMLLTSRKSPGELEDFTPKLVDRFHQGLTMLLRQPGQDGRRALIDHFARTRRLVLPEGASALIARKMAVSPRELLGLVVQLEARMQVTGKPVDMPLVRQVLGSSVAPKSVGLEDIAKAVAKYFGITIAELKAAGRARHAMEPRHCAMLLSRELTEEGLIEIGEFYKRNHSTVVHACERMRRAAAEDPLLRSHLANLRRMLGGGPESPADE